jgi:MoaA/NifB/PqqE/SkfB family radical SAM enzyme
MSDTFCVLPWLHLASHPHGGVTLCCNANHENNISSSRNFSALSNDNPNSTAGDINLNLTDHSVDELLNSDSFKQVRLEMLDGIKPHPCLRCYKEESYGIESKRVRENKIYQHFTIDQAHKITNEDGTIKPIELEFIELRLGNICNVKCRTCNPWSSSKWITDYNKIFKQLPSFNLPKFNTKVNNFDWPEREKFWEDLFNHSTNAKVFYINGGEPTLIKEHFNFLERMVRMGRTNVKLIYNINVTRINREILNIWKEFDDVELGLSIDDVGPRNEYIRHQTKWETLTNNVEFLHNNTSSNIKMSVTQTVSWMNYYYLDQLHDWAQQYGFWIHHNFVDTPDFYSPNVLPLDLRKNINARLTETIPSWSSDGKVFGLKKFEEAETNLPLLKKALKYTRTLDAIRNEKFEDVFPEIYNELRSYTHDI